MKIEISARELKELLTEKAPVDETTDASSQLLPPHTFNIFRPQEYQRIYKEAQPKVPKEE